MELMGIGFIILCYFCGKSWYISAQAKALLAVSELLPPEERAQRAREFFASNA